MAVPRAALILIVLLVWNICFFKSCSIGCAAAVAIGSRGANFMMLYEQKLHVLASLRSAGFHTVAAFLELSNMLRALPQNATLFAPSDESLATLVFSPAFSTLLLYHFAALRLSFANLLVLPQGSRIGTFLPGRSLLVTSGLGATRVSVDGVAIVVPDLYQDGSICVHGVAAPLDPDRFGLAHDQDRFPVLTVPGRTGNAAFAPPRYFGTPDPAKIVPQQPSTSVPSGSTRPVFSRNNSVAISSPVSAEVQVGSRSPPSSATGNDQGDRLAPSPDQLVGHPSTPTTFNKLYSRGRFSRQGRLATSVKNTRVVAGLSPSSAPGSSPYSGTLSTPDSPSTDISTRSPSSDRSLLANLGVHAHMHAAKPPQPFGAAARTRASPPDQGSGPADGSPPCVNVPLSPPRSSYNLISTSHANGGPRSAPVSSPTSNYDFTSRSSASGSPPVSPVSSPGSGYFDSPAPPAVAIADDNGSPVSSQPEPAGGGLAPPQYPPSDFSAPSTTGSANAEDVRPTTPSLSPVNLSGFSNAAGGPTPANPCLSPVSPPGQAPATGRLPFSRSAFSPASIESRPRSHAHHHRSFPFASPRIVSPPAYSPSQDDRVA